MGYRPKHCTMTVREAIEAGFTEIEELGEEMREWADNMEGGGLECTSKYDTVNETADCLENVASDPANLEEVPDEVLDSEVTVVEFYRNLKRMTASRVTRASNAAAKFNVAVERFREHEDNEEIVQLADELENAASEIESTEFPGMYG